MQLAIKGKLCKKPLERKELMVLYHIYLYNRNNNQLKGRRKFLLIQLILQRTRESR